VDDNFIGWAPFGIVIINAKLAGVIAMGASIMVFFLLPWLDRSPVKSCRFRPIYKWFFWIFLVDCLILGWVGANPPDGVWHGIPFVYIGRAATLWYFLHVLVFTPLIGIFETPLPLPRSIGEAVIKGGAMPAGARAKTMEKA
jgi:quinol-cytochrome oxidoreductase complex cytochrome b subunit